MTRLRSTAAKPKSPSADQVYDAGLESLESYNMQIMPLDEVVDAIAAGMSNIRSAAEMYRADGNTEDEVATYKILAKKYEELGDDFVDFARVVDKTKATPYLNAADQYYHEAIMLTTQYSNFKADITSVLELHFSRLYIIEMKAKLDPDNRKTYLVEMERYLKNSSLEKLIHRVIDEANVYKGMLYDYQRTIELGLEKPTAQTNIKKRQYEDVKRDVKAVIAQIKESPQESTKAEKAYTKTLLDYFEAHYAGDSKKALSHFLFDLGGVFLKESHSSHKIAKEKNGLKEVAKNLFEIAAGFGNPEARTQLQALTRSGGPSLTFMHRGKKSAISLLQDTGLTREFSKSTYERDLRVLGSTDFLKKLITEQTQKITSSVVEPDKLLSSIGKKLHEITSAETKTPKRLKRS